jgi:hypothetical protein
MGSSAADEATPRERVGAAKWLMVKEEEGGEVTLREVGGN